MQGLTRAPQKGLGSPGKKRREDPSYMVPFRIRTRN